jgi:DNA polymerase-3 subunit delta
MAEVQFADHEKVIKNGADLDNICFIFGDPYLVDIIKDKIISLLVPTEKNQFSVEKYEGDIKGAEEVCTAVFSDSFFSDKKIVVYNNPSFFGKSKNTKNSASKVKQHYEKNRPDLAAAALLNLYSNDFKGNDLFFDELKEKAKQDYFKDETYDSWLDSVIEYAKDNNFAPKDSKKETDVLIDNLDKKFPDKNYLIITSEKTDKKTKVYKKLKEKGLVIDCHLPEGMRKKDKEERRKAAEKVISAELSKSGRKVNIDVSAVNLLMDYSGDDLRTLSKNLNQVLTYNSGKKTVKSEDIVNILERTREDPIFVFTGAVMEKKTGDAVFFMKSLISNGYHPLQILSALSNQLVKLLAAGEFVHEYSKSYYKGMHYNQFTAAVVPEINEFDKQTANTAELFEEKGKKLKKDFYILNNKKNYYPVYLLMKSASLFTMKELRQGYIMLGELDYDIKNGSDPVRSVENFLFSFLC